MIFHVWRTNPTLLQKMAQEIVRRALAAGPPPHNVAGLKLVLSEIGQVLEDQDGGQIQVALKFARLKHIQFSQCQPRSQSAISCHPGGRHARNDVASSLRSCCDDPAIVTLNGVYASQEAMQLTDSQQARHFVALSFALYKLTATANPCYMSVEAADLLSSAP